VVSPTASSAFCCHVLAVRFELLDNRHNHVSRIVRKIEMITQARRQTVARNGLAAGLEREPWPEIDTTVAHVARVYDYLLGGKANFAVDREAA